MASPRVIIVCAILVQSCMGRDRNFPPEFRFGAGTSSYQIEGGWNDTDKSENIWDRHCHAFPGIVKDDHTGDVACDSYHKWREDVQMAADLGLHFYRFSLSWSRILPTGFPDKISESGKKYYNDLIDGLLEKGIEPFVTIFHWDMPQRLQDFGGWTNPLIADWFADYARVVYSLFGDRVKTWITINEPLIMCDGAYNTGYLAPTIKDALGSYLCSKNVLLAHAKAWRVYDEEFKPEQRGRASVVNQLIWFEKESPEVEDELIRLTRDLAVGLYSHPIYSKSGGWPPALEEFIANKSKEEGYMRSKLLPFTKEEIELVKGTFDFYALNYYTSRVVKKAGDGDKLGPWPLADIPQLGVAVTTRPEWKQAGVYWFKVHPEGLRKMLVYLKKNYGNLEYMIMENGYATTDQSLKDLDRINYIEKHLEQVLLAIKEDGVNVTAYTVWSLMDNFEWCDGYSVKFGIYDVDFEDEARPRTPRASARFYADVIRGHSLDVNMEGNKYISDEL